MTDFSEIAEMTPEQVREARGKGRKDKSGAGGNEVSEEAPERIKISAGKDDIVIPLSDMPAEDVPIRGAWLAFIPNFGVWLLIWIVMAVSLVILSAIFGLIGLAVGIFTFSAFHYYCFEKTGKKERSISEFQERLDNVYESGPALVLKPFWSLPQDLRYPTGVLQLEFETSAGAVTAAGKYKDPGEHGKEEDYESTVLGIKPVLYYMWPVKRNDLLVAVKNAPAPNDIAGLKDLFEEDILDVVRTIGGGKVWKDIMQNRLAFRDGATELLRNRIDYIINLTRLKPLALVIKHADIAQKLKDEITSKEIARYEGGAMRIKEREKRIGIAEGEAEIRNAIMAIHIKPEYQKIAMDIERNITIRQSAGEGKTTYLAFPSEIYSALGSFGGKSPAETMGVSQAVLDKMIAKAVLKVIDQQAKRRKQR